MTVQFLRRGLVVRVHVHLRRYYLDRGDLILARNFRRSVRPLGRTDTSTLQLLPLDHLSLLPHLALGDQHLLGLVLSQQRLRG